MDLDGFSNEERPAESRASFTYIVNGLFDFARTFFAIALACQSFFSPPLLSRLQVKGVALDFFDDIFLLHFPFEAPQSAFKRFAIL